MCEMSWRSISGDRYYPMWSFIIATGCGPTTASRISNWSTAHPKGQRVEDLVAFGVEMLGRYAPEIGSWAMTRTKRLS